MYLNGLSVGLEQNYHQANIIEGNNTTFRTLVKFIGNDKDDWLCRRTSKRIILERTSRFVSFVFVSAFYKLFAPTLGSCF